MALIFFIFAAWAVILGAASALIGYNLYEMRHVESVGEYFANYLRAAVYVFWGCLVMGIYIGLFGWPELE